MNAERRSFGRTGLQVSVLGFGGAELGFDDGVTLERVKALLQPAVDAGLNVIDTAAAYLASEQLVGRALEGRRERVLLFGKCSQPGVATAIVGTSSPGRWEENAGFVAKGVLPAEFVAAIRERWKEREEPGWTGQQ